MAAVTKNTDGNPAMDAEEPEKLDKPEVPAPLPSEPPLAENRRPSDLRRGTKPVASVPARKGYFTIYKKGQGYWTRMGTVGAVLLIGVLTASFLWDERENLGLHIRGGYVLVAVFSAIYAALAYHYLNKPGAVDFLIATDSEMKKVNWTSRKELMGSTRVVILFMVAIALVLFLYDLFFHTMFYLIGVLKTPPPFFPDKH